MLPIYFSDMAQTTPTIISCATIFRGLPHYLVRGTASLLFLIAHFAGTVTHADNNPDSQELLWEQALVRAVDANQIKWLRTPNEKFIALQHADFTGTLKGGVLLLHGMGAHPDWPDVISPLRTSLPQHGWSTLSIQLPVFGKGGQISDYVGTIASASQRIRAAIDHLKNNGITNVVLLGHGLGASIGVSFLASTPDSGIVAFVGVSMPTYNNAEAWMQPVNSIEKLSLPMLDIYGSSDLDSVLINSELRARAARRAGMSASIYRQTTGFESSATAKAAFSKVGGFISYRKLQIAGANHFFSGHEQTLIKRIAGWLKHHAVGVSIQN